MIATPASLRSDFIHIVGMAIYIAPESTNHITGIRNSIKSREQTGHLRPRNSSQLDKESKWQMWAIGYAGRQPG
jgi:hypothetical protein